MGVGGFTLPALSSSLAPAGPVVFTGWTSEIFALFFLHLLVLPLDVRPLPERFNPHLSRRHRSCPPPHRLSQGSDSALAGSQARRGRPVREQDVTTPTQPRVFFRGSEHAVPGGRLCRSHLASHGPSLLTSCFHPSDTLGPKPWAPTPACWVFTWPFLGVLGAPVSCFQLLGA